jgi:hypothetical protein
MPRSRPPYRTNSYEAPKPESVRWTAFKAFVRNVRLPFALVSMIALLIWMIVSGSSQEEASIRSCKALGGTWFHSDQRCLRIETIELPSAHP